ncbi:hypothetical protein BUALT_Bualt03G0021600 [Buddleja alternifolia]|uniref:Protein BREAST CANCER SUSCEPTIBILITY 1 homolog n=1 Tax=Buddleja alternifolia TaxID=168488 RepID=A0AAV6XQI0_9LAMI|nr:hypothetical protein BUALT_Bualt03G0021600 [Buddleja alternifolia]
MADTSHLERMGRELKCPICLSLLNSAVSLTCNHVFCNSCIEKSMKAASDCPVCKVPFRRREVRPAPHMDNLVSVYKSMEVASGVNIFVTQTAASTKVSGEDNQAVANIGETQDNGKTQLESLDSDVKQCQRKGSKRALMTNQRAFGSNIVKSSFPTKKRVQLPMYPTSENQLQHENLGSDFGRNSPKRSHVLPEDMPSVCEKGEPVFPPFFWLREEEDLEKSSLQTDDDQFMYTPPDAPCFSDIKDSDDEVPRKLSPERGACTLPNNDEFIDSEMFDWTQRPCSPELCSSPLAMQIEDAAEDNGAQENTKASLTNATTGLKIRPKHREGTDKKRRADKISENKGGMRMFDKKVNVGTGSRQSKRAKKTMCKVTAVHIDSDKVTDHDVQDGNKDKLLKLKRKPRKNKKVCSEASVDETASENVQSISDGKETMAIGNKTAFAYVSASEDLEKSSERNSKLKKNGKKCKRTKKTLVQPHKLASKEKAGKFKIDKGHINTEQNNEVMISRSKTNLLPLGKDKKVLEIGMTRPYEENIRQSTRSRKKVKFCEEGMSRDNSDSSHVTANGEEAVTDQKLQEIHGATDQLRMKVPEKPGKAISNLKGRVLLRCKTFPSNSHCAFCLSSEESEASGIMLHYLKGKLVAENQNTRTNAIHVHKNCTEWAPNVYFEDDNVFNLETELSRSRRIKCSCCGIKGAALGCYEKSCRKSFHVPCARLTPECRWDSENFVMLCPIHASCQLPNEMPQPESRHKTKSSAESESCLQQVKTTAERKTSSNLLWKSQKKFKNLVLCCSALTNAEKGIVSEYEKLSGVTILKNWDSSVTHVIASTDENGACRRTLKFLMGVLEGKWILSVHWIKASMEAGELVDEQHYEIAVDIHGIRDGPRIGRLRFINKQPKLFNGYTFYFTGDFVPSYKGYLHDLVIAAGGKVLNRKPIAGDYANASTTCSPTTFIIYSIELPEKCKPSDGNLILSQRRADAVALASSAGAAVASNSWILNSISGYKLQNLAD